MTAEEFIEEITFEGKKYRYVSLKKVEKKYPEIKDFPRSLKIILESLIRNFDGEKVTQKDIENLVSWRPDSDPDYEIPFTVSRVLMQDFTGVPAIVDIASMRDAFKKMGENPEKIEPLVPVDLVIDHSVQVDFYGNNDALKKNSEKEFQRNVERYRFLKWAQGSMKKLKIVPPSTGIVHQVNLEYLAKVVFINEEEKMAYFDTLVGTDSHTTMINGLGVLGWGVGGIEAEAAMLGQPVTFLAPKVVGVNVHGRPRNGVTATDIVLTLTEILRKSNVVGKFVEFFGDGIKHLALPDRATLSNMCPEYGATCALFPVDEESISYLETTGRDRKLTAFIQEYMKKQGLFGNVKSSYSELIDFDLDMIEPTIAGPKLPQQKVALRDSGKSFLRFMDESNESSEKNKSNQKTVSLKSVKINIDGKEETLKDGDIVIAAITSCTNTSNPRVMIGAGLLAKRAVELGLKVNSKVKTSLAPGSRVVSEYLKKSGLQKYLDELGFNIVGFGCTTCIGNSGPLRPEIEDAIVNNNMYTVSVLSGNRNFEARIHRNVRANYLMSPMLVVAYAIAGTININMDKEPIGKGKDGKDVFLKDLWPEEKEISEEIRKHVTSDLFRSNYEKIGKFSELWNELDTPEGVLYKWDEKSTYIRNPPFFDNFSKNEEKYSNILNGLKVLAVFGDSITTDHISPAGSIGKNSPAGQYLIEKGVNPEDFNSFGSRRGNHEVMMRGTFGNNRIRNLLVEKEGPRTVDPETGKDDWIYNVAMKLREKGGSIVIAGKEYGSGSSRDWAAKGPYLLGVKAVIAESFERIHRSNLVCMGVLPLQFKDGKNFKSLNIDVTKEITLKLSEKLEPRQNAIISYTNNDGEIKEFELMVRLDTPVEVKYYLNGGILPFVMRKM